MPSGSTRLTEAFLYSFPLIVLKSSANAIDADSAAKIANVALFIVTRACQISLSLSILKWPSAASQDRARIVFDCRTANDPAMINKESTNENNTDVDRG